MNKDKYITKSYYKATGKIHEKNTLGGYFHLVIVKKGKRIRYLKFWAFGSSEVAEKAMVFEVGMRVKCRFVISSKFVKGAWRTGLELKDIDHWKVNEEKLKKAERMEQGNSHRRSNAGLFDHKPDLSDMT